MSMFNDIDWTMNGNSIECISNSKQVSDYAKEFQRGHWSLFGLGNVLKKVWDVRSQARRKSGPASQSDDSAIPTMWSSRLPSYKCAQPRNIEGEIRKKHYVFMSMLNDIDWTMNGNSIECISNSKQVSELREGVSARTIQLMLRINHSANQLSVNGAVSTEQCRVGV